MDAAILAGLKVEHAPPRYASRYAVDGAEQVSRIRVALNYGPKAGIVGAMFAGLGFGVGLAALEGMGVSRGGEH
jgi:hypothetical protein